ncbi:Protein of unknown function [Methylobacterium sp. 174MFSha1.1]|uniref:DUF3800 domain-containing protein n=1 Tax=Methylobacterium sp. 174MFSha1.1 TaxID=1502749 RepID=UPI0008EDBBD4|nr:DUF3800 domain-containing protein [Methylobacterium sp. 174MFSha1.1]SFV12627.1 Protein of unknown function [Methylobacterium sp. 174MFSha1.1]
MTDLINVYCDESCHLERDRQTAMVFGAIWCAEHKRYEISQRIKDIRARHGMPPSFEFKWTKVGQSKLQMYMDLVDYFFDDSDIHFRALVIPDKSIIDHNKFNQIHDDWYYKMYFNMIKVILKPLDSYNIYLDIKDTKSHSKSQKLHDVLCNNAYDFQRNMIRKVQHIRSHEAAQSQLADVLIGALSYKFRGKNTSAAKLSLIERIAQRSGYGLNRSTLYKEEKFNILVWQGREEQ